MNLTEEDLKNIKIMKIVKEISHNGNGEVEITKKLVARVRLGSFCLYVGEEALVGALRDNYKNSPITQKVGKYLFQGVDVPRELCPAKAYA
jgi:hypothetical protein